MTNKFDILKETLYTLAPNIEELFLTRKAISLDKFLEVISTEGYDLASSFACSSTTVTRLLDLIIPKRHRGEKPCTYLLRQAGYKWCGKCQQALLMENFSNNKAKRDGLATQCRPCASVDRAEYQREYQSRRRATKLSRTPKWANIVKIGEIYKNCPEGYHVDHIIPLQGKLVSGLHVENNLQYLSSIDNCSKNNSFDIDKFNNNESWYKTNIPEKCVKKLNKTTNIILSRKCVECSKDFVPVQDSTTHCSSKCSTKHTRRDSCRDVQLGLTKEFVQQLIWDKPFSVGCKEVNLSDNGLKKMALRLGCIMPPAYYHSKSSTEKIRLREAAFLKK